MPLTNPTLSVVINAHCKFMKEKSKNDNGFKIIFTWFSSNTIEIQ